MHLCRILVYDRVLILTGFANQQGMLYKGMRWSTAHGYLRPAMDRDNLDVAINSQVNQVNPHIYILMFSTHK